MNNTTHFWLIKARSRKICIPATDDLDLFYSERYDISLKDCCNMVSGTLPNEERQDAIPHVFFTSYGTDTP